MSRLLGLGMRAGRVVVGVAAVRARLQQGAIKCVVLAADASDRTLEKVQRLAQARGVPVLRGPEARELGRRLGRDTEVQAVGIEDHALARGVVESIGGVQ
ncbi:MAG TPA: ribosomal L7Ae/L30e/S12e/Gadd45 family protein [Gemmatimonadales bacterium]|nr:ribosomal L7Ae/L30e/S12e/Gadd45 family protein [Gemmatimonadales bacterium]